jgi:hypothetical protein
MTVVFGLILVPRDMRLGWPTGISAFSALSAVESWLSTRMAGG